MAEMMGLCMICGKAAVLQRCIICGAAVCNQCLKDGVCLNCWKGRRKK